MTKVAQEELPPRCTVCGSDTIVVSYQVPVYVLLWSGRAVRVVVVGEEVEFAKRAWCRSCGDRWELDVEPQTEPWPAWEVGW